jgi:hypothetical protein
MDYKGRPRANSIENIWARPVFRWRGSRPALLRSLWTAYEPNTRLHSPLKPPVSTTTGPLSNGARAHLRVANTRRREPCQGPKKWPERADVGGIPVREAPTFDSLRAL